MILFASFPISMVLLVPLGLSLGFLLDLLM